MAKISDDKRVPVTRRTLLKGSAAAGAGVLLAGGAPWHFGRAAYAEEAEKTFGLVPQWAGGPDTPQVAQRALTVAPEVRAFSPTT